MDSVEKIKQFCTENAAYFLGKYDMSTAALVLMEVADRLDAMTKEPVGVMCVNCGSSWDDERLREEKQKNQKLLSCCPERKVIPLFAAPSSPELTQQPVAIPAAHSHPSPVFGQRPDGSPLVNDARPAPDIEADDDADFNALLETAYVDPGANPPVSYKDKVKELEAREAAMLEAQRHASNEWADIATNGYQWLKNIREGISTFEEAIADMESGFEYCRAVSASVPDISSSPDIETQAAAMLEAIRCAVRDAEDDNNNISGATYDKLYLALSSDAGREYADERNNLIRQLADALDDLRSFERWSLSLAEMIQNPDDYDGAEDSQEGAISRWIQDTLERLRKAEEELVHAAQQNAYHHSHLKQLRAELEECKGKVERAAEGER